MLFIITNHELFLCFYFREGFDFRIDGQPSNQSDPIYGGSTTESINSQSQSTIQESNVIHLDHILHSEIRSNVERINRQEADNQQRNAEGERRGLQQSTFDLFSEERNTNAENMDGDWQENPVDVWQHATPENVEESNLQQSQGVWHEDLSRQAARNWGATGPTRTRQAFHMRRYSRLHRSDDDSIYSMELRELLSR